ncbi:MAG: DUF6758 family protein [Nocardioidaceae bacterium]
MRQPLTVIEPDVAVTASGLSSLRVPLWAPWPIPASWTFAGAAHTDAATVGCWWAEDPFGDPTEVMFVCEEAGAGVGAHLSGLPRDYPNAEVGVGPPHARFTIEGHVLPLWAVDAEPLSPTAPTAVATRDRAVYAGEAAGRWLWTIVHPAEAGVIVIQPLTLLDARALGAELELLPLGELSPRLVIAAAPEPPPP